MPDARSRVEQASHDRRRAARPAGPAAQRPTIRSSQHPRLGRPGRGSPRRRRSRFGALSTSVPNDSPLTGASSERASPVVSQPRTVDVGLPGLTRGAASAEAAVPTVTTSATSAAADVRRARACSASMPQRSVFLTRSCSPDRGSRRLRPAGRRTGRARRPSPELRGGRLLPRAAARADGPARSQVGRRCRGNRPALRGGARLPPLVLGVVPLASASASAAALPPAAPRRRRTAATSAR